MLVFEIEHTLVYQSTRKPVQEIVYQKSQLYMHGFAVIDQKMCKSFIRPIRFQGNLVFESTIGLDFKTQLPPTS